MDIIALLHLTRQHSSLAVSNTPLLPSTSQRRSLLDLSICFSLLYIRSLVMHLHLVWTFLSFAAAVAAQQCSGHYGQCPDQFVLFTMGLVVSYQVLHISQRGFVSQLIIYSGSSNSYCGSGCQNPFGVCTSLNAESSGQKHTISKDGTCGQNVGYTCPDGQCCSQYGYW